jgi:hypothetical protein
VVADPGFRHAAKAFAATDYARVTECTTSRFVLRDNAARMFGVGDHVELDFDGVPRRVIEVGPDFLVVDQPLAAPPVTVQSVANWGATSDFRWDLRPADDSPARRSGSGGRDMGSSLSVQDYVKGDFDGDGKRDLPEMPAE